ncbi:SGNH/GDSL hydrolase family protein [Furfurilactobacillus entadae]|uniref:SGNH/GDSL hydrolase family protein n=1 Tax=Furfurilactobacillus entadae TaxID=2922307 RepID=UPI0035E46A5A
MNLFRRIGAPWLAVIVLFTVLGILCQQAGAVQAPAVSQPQPMQSAPSKKTQPKTSKKITLVALGDSLTEGIGDQRKQGGYVGQIKTQLTKKADVDATTYNYGKAGDRSDQIQARLTKSATMQNRIKHANVIVMTVGGNDLMQGLQSATISGESSVPAMNQVVKRTQQGYATKLQSLLTQVRQLNPKAPIFLFGIYNPVYVYFANITQLNTYIQSFNQTTQTAAASYKQLYFMNINETLSYGQYNTVKKRSALAAKDAAANENTTFDGKAIEKSLVSGSTGELNDYLSPADHFHPNYSGYTKMTDILYKTMRQHDGWLS